MRLLNAIDVYVQSFADAAMTRMPLRVKNPDAAVSDEPNNSPDEEELLPDERPRRSRYDEADAAGKAWEKSSLQLNTAVPTSTLNRCRSTGPPPFSRQTRTRPGMQQISYGLGACLF